MPEYHWLKYPGHVGDSMVVPGVAGEALGQGELVHISGNSSFAKSDKTDLGTIYVQGVALTSVAIGGAVEVQTGGAAEVLFDAGLALTPGDAIFLSDNGKATNIAPTTPGEASVEIGELFDSSMYTPANPYAQVVIEVEEPVILS